MAKKYDCWVIKNKRGVFFWWTFGETRRACRRSVNDWKWCEKIGHKSVKVKLVEVK